MEKTEIENLILIQLYDWWEHHRGSSVYHIFQQIKEGEVEKSTFTKIALDLEEKYLIKGVGFSLECNITPEGILEAEKRGLIAPERLALYENIRNEILKAAFEAHELEGKRGEAESGKVIRSNAFSETEFHNNLRFLKQLNLIDSGNGWYFRSTPSGREQFKKWHQQNSLIDKFEEIKNLTPQKRGVELQKVIAQALEFSGWQQEESVKTSFEEIDIIIYKNREIYLIECKWENKPIQPIAVNHLLSKLHKRAGTNGIIMSMSGFTSGAVQNVEESTNEKLVLLFGEEDIKEIIENASSFESLLTEKHKMLVSRRKADFK